MARYRVTFDLDISYTRPALFKGKDSRDVDLMLLAVVDVPNKASANRLDLYLAEHQNEWFPTQWILNSFEVREVKELQKLDKSEEVKLAKVYFRGYYTYRDYKDFDYYGYYEIKTEKVLNTDLKDLRRMM